MPSNTLLRFLRARSQEIPSIYQRCSPQTPPRAAQQARRASGLTRRQRTAPDGNPPLRRCPALPPRAASAPFSSSACRANGYYNGKSGQDERPLTWQERLWGLAARRGSKPLQPNDLPGREDDIFAPRRTMSAKAALEPRVRCTEVDERGETTITDGEFKKTELIAKVNTSPRTSCLEPR